jgi:hypothetical protein
MKSIDYKELVLLQCNNYGCSWLVSVHGEAQFAGNGLSPCQEVQRRPWALTSQPLGRSCGILPLRFSICKGPAIHCTLRLAAKPHRSAESAIITLKEY